MCDANEYLTQEEEYYQLELSVRQSGRELLNALLTVFYRETADGASLTAKLHAIVLYS